MLGRASPATGAHNDSTTCFAQALELAEVHDPVVTIGVLLDAAPASWILAGPDKSLPLAEARLHARHQCQKHLFRTERRLYEATSGPRRGRSARYASSERPRLEGSWGGGVGGTTGILAPAGGLGPGW